MKTRGWGQSPWIPSDRDKRYLKRWARRVELEARYRRRVRRRAALIALASVVGLAVLAFGGRL